MYPFPASLAYTLYIRGAEVLRRGWCEPLLVSARTSSVHVYRQWWVGRVPIRGRGADQYWSKNYPCGARSQSLWLCRRLFSSLRYPITPRTSVPAG